MFNKERKINMKIKVHKRHYLMQLAIGVALLSLGSNAWGGEWMWIMPPDAEELSNMKWTWSGPQKSEYTNYTWQDKATLSYTGKNGREWSGDLGVYSYQKKKIEGNPSPASLASQPPTLVVSSSGLWATYVVAPLWPESPWIPGVLQILFKPNYYDSLCKVELNEQYKKYGFHCPSK